MPANPDNPSSFPSFTPFWKPPKTHLRFEPNVLAFKVKRSCVSGKTYLRLAVNALAFFPVGLNIACQTIKSTLRGHKTARKIVYVLNKH